MATLFGEYMNGLKINKSKVSRLLNIKLPRMNDLCNDHDAKPYAEEFYKIIYSVNKLAGLGEESFALAVQKIFPDRVKVNLLKEFEDLSPEVRFFKKYTLKQREIEKKLGIANGKFSKYFTDPSKRVLAIEIIEFAEGMNLEVLTVFKEIYGELKITYD